MRLMGHTLSDNRHGLIASAMVTMADGHAGREAAKAMIHDACQVVGDDRKLTVGADKAYDVREFIDALQAMNVVPTWHRTRQSDARQCRMRLPVVTAIPSHSKSAS